jgi:hypothetical protein
MNPCASQKAITREGIAVPLAERASRPVKAQGR